MRHHKGNGEHTQHIAKRKVIGEFPRIIIDRNLIGDLIRGELPTARVVVGVSGYPFIQIEGGNPLRFIMWDTQEFKVPVVLEHIPALPGQMTRMKVAYTEHIGLITVGPAWITLCVHSLVRMAREWLDLKEAE